MYIRRHIESVVSRMAKRKPVIVLTGARQVGKSTMLREVYRDIGTGALICLAKKRLPLTENVWIQPVGMI